MPCSSARTHSSPSYPEAIIGFGAWLRRRGKNVSVFLLLLLGISKNRRREGNRPEIPFPPARKRSSGAPGEVGSSSLNERALLGDERRELRLGLGARGGRGERGRAEEEEGENSSARVPLLLPVRPRVDAPFLRRSRRRRPTHTCSSAATASPSAETSPTSTSTSSASSSSSSSSPKGERDISHLARRQRRRSRRLCARRTSSRAAAPPPTRAAGPRGKKSKRGHV